MDTLAALAGATAGSAVSAGGVKLSGRHHDNRGGPAGLKVSARVPLRRDGRWVTKAGVITTTTGVRVHVPRTATVRVVAANSAIVTTHTAASDQALMKPTVLVAEKLGAAGIELLEKVAVVDCSYNLSPEDLCAKVSECDALIVRSGTKVTREVFDASKGRLKVFFWNT